jgi:acetyltransferase-like isoleucine patch superfamily enzyme/dTDP-4-dehydrorhamnose 3,5-epimerase-like enzyme
MASNAPVNVEVSIHPRALCESPHLGSGTRVGAFTHVLPGARIGGQCLIGDHVFIDDDVVLGDRVTVRSGVQLWNGLRVADDVFIGENATFATDPLPRSRHFERAIQPTHIARGASIGAAAVVLPGVRVGAESIIGAGAVVAQDVPPRSIVSGNPAHIIGYVDAKGTRTGVSKPTVPLAQDVVATSVPGVTVHRLTLAVDPRGSLVATEVPAQLPFQPKRCFIVFDAPGKDVRGEHAHRQCHQFLVCPRGSLSVMVDDGVHSEEIVLDQPDIGVHVPPMVWAVQYKYTADAILVVLASDPYDPADYIRDYEEFRALVRVSDASGADRR